MGADLFSLLVQSGNSLGAHSAAMSVAGNNVANANTPGYARQIANLAANPGVGALGAGGIGTGVSLVNITQARDQFVERQMPNALAAQSRSQTESDALSALTALNPDLEGGLPTEIGAFYSSLQTWSQNPGDPALRQNVLGNTQALVTSFNQTASAISSARTGLDASITGKVSEINAAAKSLADINKQIEIAKAAGGQPNDLLDQRQTAIDTLATLTGATPYTDAAGEVSMALPGGTALVVNGSAGSFSAVPDPANNGLLMLRLNRADGSPPTSWDGTTLGGTMGGLFAARDGALKTAADSVDDLAFNMATTLNTLQQNGYDVNSNPGAALFILPATATGAAAQIRVNPALTALGLASASTSPAATGDNTNVLAMIGTQSAPLLSGANPAATMQTIVTAFGTSSSQADALAAHDTAMATNLQNLRDATAGVSIDEEMINLTKAQRAYEAVAKVISTANQMLDTLMSIAG
jgi:flagellar hook-associated protein 1 FlgK